MLRRKTFVFVLFIACIIVALQRAPQVFARKAAFFVDRHNTRIRHRSIQDQYTAASPITVIGRYHAKCSPSLRKHLFTSDEKHAETEQDAQDIASSSVNPEDILDEERRANLFQFLLRDLQVEGVPLLTVDADQVETLQAAVWTTMAELLTGWKTHKGKQKEMACLIFEDIPIEALRSFVTDFQIFQTQDRLMQNLPELSCFRLAMVGRGVGPAMTITIEPLCGDETASISDDFFTRIEPVTLDERKIIAAMKMFVDRVACGMNICPHFNFDLEIQISSTGYRVSRFSDVCHLLSSFWNAVCELQATSSEKLSAIILLLPAINDMKTTKDSTGLFMTGPEQQHSRFLAVSDLISRSLCLYDGNSAFELLYFSPIYDRDSIQPKDDKAFGHLPPLQWLRPILQQYYNLEGIDESSRTNISIEDLQLANYQRRSPVTAICIKRVSMIEDHTASEKSSSSIEVEVEGVGQNIRTSSLRNMARNVLELVAKGQERLQSELDEEIAIANSEE